MCAGMLLLYWLLYREFGYIAVEEARSVTHACYTTCRPFFMIPVSALSYNMCRALLWPLCLVSMPGMACAHAAIEHNEAPR